MPEQRQRLPERSRTEHILGLRPVVAGLSDALVQVGEVHGAVGVRVEAHQHAFLPRHPALGVQQVESSRIGIERQVTAPVPDMADDASYVERIVG